MASKPKLQPPLKILQSSVTNQFGRGRSVGVGVGGGAERTPNFVPKQDTKPSSLPKTRIIYEG